MKLLPSSLAALTVSLLAAPPALAMDQRQADAICATWKLECPAGTAATPGPAKKTGVLECKTKGRPVKEGPSLTCKDGKALAWGDWKAGKKEGLQVTLRPDRSWTEERFTSGQLEGRSVEYSAEGQLLSETSFQAGKKHGAERTFSVDGRLASEQFWALGVKSKKPEPEPAAVAATPPAPTTPEAATPEAAPPEATTAEATTAEATPPEATPPEATTPAPPASAKAKTKTKGKSKAQAGKAAAAPEEEGAGEGEEAPAEESKVAAEKPPAPAAESEAPAAKTEDAQAGAPQP